jgi:hypothetical protein
MSSNITINVKSLLYFMVVQQNMAPFRKTHTYRYVLNHSWNLIHLDSGTYRSFGFSLLRIPKNKFFVFFSLGPAGVTSFLGGGKTSPVFANTSLFVSLAVTLSKSIGAGSESRAGVGLTSVFAPEAESLRRDTDEVLGNWFRAIPISYRLNVAMLGEPEGLSPKVGDVAPNVGLKGSDLRAYTHVLEIRFV